MSESPRRIQHLLVTNADASVTTLRAAVGGFVQRGLGIWPSVVQVGVCEPERLLLPQPNDLSAISNIDLKIGLDTGSVTVARWDLIDVREADHGSTTDNPIFRSVEWVWTLEDKRRLLQGQRGGMLWQGVLNRLRPDGSIIDRVNNSDLVQHCITAIQTMTYREGLPLSAGLIASLNVFDPPVELVWQGAHAPTELQRLLEWTRHAFAYNQDGTYSIVRLTAPGQSPVSPPMGQAKLPAGEIILNSDAPQKVIITSAPTRNLIERKRTLDAPNPLQWVGVDVDGSVLPLTDLSWWPAGKTPIEVYVKKFVQVDVKYQNLARASLFKMLQLHDDDLTQGWTLVGRLLDEQSDALERGIPLAVRLKAKAALQNEQSMWVQQSELVPIPGASIDLERGVIKSPQALIKLDLAQQPDNEIGTGELGAGDLELTFCHLPNAGGYSDYYMGVFEWDGAAVVKVADPDPPDPPHTAVNDALAEGVPIYTFADLQVNYREQAHPSTDVDPVNDAVIDALALKYAGSIIATGKPRLRIEQYPLLHNVDPDGSVATILWDANNLVTTLHLGNFFQISSEYIRRIAQHRSLTGGSYGAPRGGGSGGGGGIARSSGAPPASGALGPSTGKRIATDLAVPALLEAPHLVRQPFWAKITGSPGSGLYSFSQVKKTNTGSGAAQWTAGSFTGTARELDGDTVATNSIVLMWPVAVYKADGSVPIEYWFDASTCDLAVTSQINATVVTGGSITRVGDNLRLTLTRATVTFSKNACGVLVGVSSASASSVTSDLAGEECT